MIYKKNWKYILIKDDSYWCKEHKFFRPKALKDFSDVTKGDVGGFIKGFRNLFQTGNCWVYDNAMVDIKARVYENAKIKNYAYVAGMARIFGNAQVKDSAQVLDNVVISGNAVVSDYARIYDNVQITGNTYIRNFKVIHGNKIISKK
jgi:acyl-[acyl carrier protein]--UDP-N-acetylglucosamine O-acyltransferase